jgi:hypothetical protein
LDEEALGALVNEAVQQLEASRLAKYRWADRAPVRVINYRLRVFLTDAIPQLIRNRAIDATIILGTWALGSGDFVEGTIKDLRYMAERLGLDVTLHVRCRDANR